MTTSELTAFRGMKAATLLRDRLAAWDMSLQRQARLSERLNLVFRSDFFNLTNHPNFDRPGLIYRTSNFGNISSAENSRQIQFSLRLNW